MQRSACLLTFLTLLVGACGDDKGGDDTTTNTTPSTMSGISGMTSLTTMTTPSTATETPTSDASAESTAGESSSEPTGGMSSTTFDPNDCGEAMINIPIVTPSVMLVLDKSGSMVADPGGYWDHDNDPATPTQTRWKSLFATVDFIVNNFNNSMNLGMNLFPSKSAKADYSEAACPVNDNVEVPIAPTNAAAILAAMPAADDTSIKGGTPSAKGITAALNELLKVQDDQPKFMVLVTDGAANCQVGAPDTTTLFEVYDENLATVVADAFAQGIPTYVIGIGIQDMTTGTAKDGNPDSTNPFQRLNEVADAGGVPRAGDVKFYDTQNQIELQDALNDISMQILSCDPILLDPPPKYWEYVEVAVDGTPYGSGMMQVTDCMTESGWQYTDETHTAIRLCGEACEKFQTTGALDAQYRCPNSG
ncbi:MAG: VWA domain-containing protein [Myxococcales bacterium]|nr:VWA domain-containing protein [Myxococcales bacterium]